ncbi:MAG: ribulose-phosphate 3-epimerase [Actinobacteria bacterium]|nr:ribulose-phosphate 3-epimerase [Actinomycetota bacterium]
MSNLKIAPSILSADFGDLLGEVRRVEEGGADLLHVDVMDGHFVPNITVGPLVVEALHGKTKLPLDVHLMIERPEQYVGQFARAGASYITVHAEACPHLHRVVALIKEKGALAGVALNPATPLTVLDYILGDVDLMLIMSVNPGFGGQAFIPSAVPKIQALKRLIDDRGFSADIEVDGGINAKTAPEVVGAGARILVAGSAIFGQKDVKEAISSLRVQ